MLVTIIIIHVELRLKSQSFFKGSEFSRCELSRSNCCSGMGVSTSEGDGKCSEDNVISEGIYYLTHYSLKY